MQHAPKHNTKQLSSVPISSAFPSSSSSASRKSFQLLCLNHGFSCLCHLQFSDLLFEHRIVHFDISIRRLPVVAAVVAKYSVPPSAGSCEDSHAVRPASVRVVLGDGSLLRSRCCLGRHLEADADLLRGAGSVTSRFSPAWD